MLFAAWVMMSLPGQAQPISLISTGAVWKYLDSGVDPGSAWLALAFDDGAWPSGPAQLGFGDGDEATLLNSSTPGGRLVTAYLRHRFVVAGAGGISNLTASLLYDDGGVVYVNGVEAFRVGMPAGPVNYTTLATTTVSDNALYTASLSPNLLVNGTNVVAVEVHQVTAVSTDLSFDFALTGNVAPLPPTAPVITQQPTNQSRCVGQSAMFAVSATGTPPLRYQWQKNGVPIAGGTNANLALESLHSGHAANYAVVVSNVAGSTLSSNAFLAILPPLTGPGAVDPGYQPVVGGWVRDLIVQPDGRVLLLGNFTNVNGLPQTNLARLNLDGTLDTTFRPTEADGLSALTCMVLLSDGKIVLADRADWPPGQPLSPRLIRLHGDGSLDSSFAPSTTNSWLGLQSGDRLVGVSYVEERWRVCRYLADGALDPSFQAAEIGSDTGRIWVQPDDRILVASHLGGSKRLARLNADGSLDGSFQVTLDSDLYALAVQPDGKILLNGSFSYVNGIPALHTARLNPDGTLDPQFVGDIQGAVSCSTLQPDGRILVGGNLWAVNGVTRYRLARLENDGALDASFDAGIAPHWSGELDYVSRIGLQPDGGIVVLSVFVNSEDDICQMLERRYGGPLAPVITRQPASQTVFAGHAVTFAVNASGTALLFHQWLFNGLPITDATNSTLTLENVQVSNAGGYYVIVSNALNTVTSVWAHLTVSGSEPGWQWARSGGGGGLDMGHNVAVDAAGNTFVVGSFAYSAEFEDQVVQAESEEGLFIARYNAAGRLMWVRQAEGTARFFGYSDAVTDSMGNLWIAEEFRGTAMLGAFSLESRSEFDLFFAKFSPDGQVLWVLQGPPTDPDSMPILAADAAGRVVAAAPFYAQGELGGHPLTNADHGVFVAQFDNTGRAAWVQTATSIGTSFRGFDLEVEPNGNVLFAGAAWYGATFGDLRFTNSAETSLLLVKCNPAGQPLWARQVGDAGLQMAYEGLDLAVGPSGQAYVLGGFCGTGSLGGFQMTSRGWGDAFVIKFSGAGDVLWANQAGGSFWDMPRQLVVDAADQCALLGDFIAPWAVSSTDGRWLTNTNAGYGIASFDPVGRARWAATTSGYKIAPAPGGGLYSLGDDHGLWLTRLGEEGQTLWTAQGNASDRDFAYDWAVDRAGNVHIVGGFSGNASYGDHHLGSEGGYDILVATLNAGLPVPNNPGSPDLTFTPTIERSEPQCYPVCHAPVQSIVVQPDGRILVAGGLHECQWQRPHQSRPASAGWNRGPRLPVEHAWI